MNIFNLSTAIVGYGFVTINSGVAHVSLEMQDEGAEVIGEFELDHTELDDIIEMLQEARILAFGDK